MKISKAEWNQFEKDRKSGHMNMFSHYLARKFVVNDNYEKAYEWFEAEGNSQDLVIE